MTPNSENVEACLQAVRGNRHNHSEFECVLCDKAIEDDYIEVPDDPLQVWRDQAAMIILLNHEIALRDKWIANLQANLKVFFHARQSAP